MNTDNEKEAEDRRNWGYRMLRAESYRRKRHVSDTEYFESPAYDEAVRALEDMDTGEGA